MARKPKLRYIRRGIRDLFETRRRRLKRWTAAVSTVLEDTGTGKNFTVSSAGVAATGTLTIASGNAGDAETVVIDGKTYTFESTLTNSDGSVFVGSSASVSLDNLIAAINLSPRLVLATGALTFVGNAEDTETVTLGSITYIFDTVLTDSANHVLIGETASDSINNLVAAIKGAAGAGTLYGTGTVANASATAVNAGSDVMAVTALTTSSVPSTSTVADATWGAETLMGGFSRYASATVLHPTVSAAAGDGDTMVVTAKTVGSAGNEIEVDDTMATGAWGAETLAGGIDADGLTIADHGYDTGDGPFVVSTTGTIPEGLATDALYWVSVPDTGHVLLHSNEKAAYKGNSIVDITSAGSGTHTLTPATTQQAVIEFVRQGNSVAHVTLQDDVDDLI